MRRVMQPNDDLALSNSADEARLSADTRVEFGASYYWVLDLAGSVWERTVSVGHPAGRRFEDPMATGS